MDIIIHDDVFTSDAEALVNTVNCVGVMGKGLALEFKRRFPGMFAEYQALCRAGKIVPGKVSVYTLHYTPVGYIINFPTKRHWWDKSRLEDIESGLVDLVRVVEDLHISSIAIPKLGCNLGGLDWKVVRPMIISAFENTDVFLYISA